MTVDWGNAAQIGGIVFGIVFVVLIILAVVMWLVGLVLSKVDSSDGETSDRKKGA